MPNWCSNELTITGDEKALARLVEMVKTEQSEFDFNAVIPYPKVYADLDRDTQPVGKGYNSGGYEWCIQNWGTKWPACEVNVGKDLGAVSYLYDTAWGPSLPITKALAVAFPELTFTHKYEEGGADFSGLQIYEGGVLVNEAEGDYNAYPVFDHPDEQGDE